MPRRLLLAPLMLLVVLVLPSSGIRGGHRIAGHEPGVDAHAVRQRGSSGHRSVAPGRDLGHGGRRSPLDQVDLRCAYLDPDGTVNTGHAVRRRRARPRRPGRHVHEGRRAARSGWVPHRRDAGRRPARGCHALCRARGTSARSRHGIRRRRPERGAVRNFSFGSTRPTLDADFTSIGDGGAPSDMAPVDDSGDLPYFVAGALVRERRAATGSRRRPARPAPRCRSTGSTPSHPHAAVTALRRRDDRLGSPVDHDRQARASTRTTGDVTHVSTEPFVTCPTAGGANVTAIAADTTNCGSFRQSGVAVERTVVLHVATRSMETKDRWVSTDGKAHDIDALYSEIAARGRSGAGRLPVPLGRRLGLPRRGPPAQRSPRLRAASPRSSSRRTRPPATTTRATRRAR